MTLHSRPPPPLQHKQHAPAQPAQRLAPTIRRTGHRSTLVTLLISHMKRGDKHGKEKEKNTQDVREPLANFRKIHGKYAGRQRNTNPPSTSGTNCAQSTIRYAATPSTCSICEGWRSPFARCTAGHKQREGGTNAWEENQCSLDPRL